MIKFENTEVMNFEGAIRGMRNPLNSWDKSDSFICLGGDDFDDCKTNNIDVIIKINLSKNDIAYLLNLLS